MAKKKLESFKIAETRKPTVKTNPKKAEEAEVPGAQSLGFRRIEGILEAEQSASVQASLRKIVSDLEELESKGSNKAKAAAKKAILAVERTLELMEYLFQTKEAMVVAATQPSTDTPDK